MVAREEEETLHDRGSVASRSRIKRKDGVFDPFLATVPERHFCTFFFFFSFSSSISTKSTRIRVRLRRHARQMGRLGPFEISPGEDFGGFIAHDARKCRTRGRRRGRFATKNGDRVERNREEERQSSVLLFSHVSNRDDRIGSSSSSKRILVSFPLHKNALSEPILSPKRPSRRRRLGRCAKHHSHLSEV